MLMETSSQKPIDSIVLPNDLPTSEVVEKKSTPPALAHASHTVLFTGIFFVAAIIYSIPGLGLLALFPRPDGSMNSVQSLATLVYIIGGCFWLILGIIGLLRINSIKENSRIKLKGIIRLAVGILPLLIISALVPLLINRAPALTLEVLKPEASTDLIAPMTMTFGMPTALQYFASQKLTPLKYAWDFTSDGVTDQETFNPTGTFIFKKAGVFTVTAMVMMTNNEKKKVSLTLLIPRESFVAIPEEPILNEPVTFSLDYLYPKSTDAKTPQITKAKWDFDNDGVIDSETEKTSISYIYHTLGEFLPSVTITLSNQTEISLNREILVSEPPKQPFPITLTTDPVTLLGPPPLGVLFTLKTDEDIADALWDFGNGKSAQGLRVAQVYPTVGTFTATATVRSRSGAVARLSKVIRVTNPLQIPDLSFEGTPSVNGLNIRQEVPVEISLKPITAQPLVSFSWDTDEYAEDVVIAENMLKAVYRDPGTYYIDVIGIDPDQNVLRKRLTVQAMPAKSFVSFNVEPTSPVAPARVTFDASDTFIPSEDITGFEWNFGERTTDTSTKFTGARTEHTFQTPGTYIITLTVRTTSGKSLTSTQTIVVRAPLINACFLASRTSGKAPLGVRFDSSCSTGSFASWTWTFGDQSESDQESPTHVFLNPGEYTVTLVAKTADGQQSSQTLSISVTP